MALLSEPDSIKRSLVNNILVFDSECSPEHSIPPLPPSLYPRPPLRRISSHFCNFFRQNFPGYFKVQINMQGHSKLLGSYAIWPKLVITVLTRVNFRFSAIALVHSCSYLFSCHKYWKTGQMVTVKNDVCLGGWYQRTPTLWPKSISTKVGKNIHYFLSSIEWPTLLA